jgi:phospholipase D1/2
MQSLVFGSQSLLSRIRRSIMAQQLRAGKKATEQEIQQVREDDNNQKYLEIPMEDCFKYVTLLNLRNWAALESQEYDTRYVSNNTKQNHSVIFIEC